MNFYQLEIVIHFRWVLIIFLIWVLAIDFTAIGQNNPVQIFDPYNLTVRSNGLTKYEHPDLNNAYTILTYNRYEAAFQEFEKAAEQFQKFGDWVGYVASLNEEVFIYCQTRDYENGFSLVSEVLKTSQEKLGPDHILFSDALFHYGQLYYLTGEVDKALETFLDALELRRRKFGTNHLSVAGGLNVIGDVYRFGSSNYQKAEDYYSQALEIWERLLPPTSGEIAKLYYNLATTNRLKGDFDRALTYVTAALQIYQKAPPPNINRLGNTYIVIANIYFEKKEYPQAIEYANQAIDLIEMAKGKNADVLSYYYNNLGAILVESGDLGGAIEYYHKALSINLKNPNLNLPRSADNYLNLGLAYESIEFDSALYYQKKSLEIRREYYGENHWETIVSFLYLGRLFESRDFFDSAFQNYQKALILAVPDFESNDILERVPASSIPNISDLVDIFSAKADLFSKLYYRDSTPLEYLEAALDNYLLAQYALTLNRRSYEREGSMLLLAQLHRAIYENSLDCTYQLFQLTGDLDYIYKAFDFMERSKSILLLESLNRAEAFNLAGIPDNLKNEERSLKREIARLQFELDKEENYENPRQENISQLESQIFQVSKKQENLKESLKKNYPNYFEIKYNLDTVGLSVIQPLLEEQKITLLEFFWGDNTVFGLSVSGVDYKFLKAELNDSLINGARAYLSEIAAIPPFEYPLEDFARFTQNSYYLFEQLVLPLVPHEDPNKRLLIVSDGLLTFMPFESLLTEQMTPTEVDFQNLPYLVNLYQTSYANSANLYFKSLNIDLPSSANRLLAFSYSSQETGNLQSGDLSILRGMGFNELPGAAKELKAITTLMEGQFFWGDDATEHQFKSNAGAFDILHLAIHGEGGQNEISDTRLIFRDLNDSIEDGSLYPYELYDLKLNTRLVILSACETGIGKYYQGEGMYSMARAFAYSGNPSLISSFWKINDNTTYKLISNLYEALTSGKRIDESLQTAKKEYIQQADYITAHPSNWAALVAFGNMQPIFSPANNTLYYLLIGAIIIAGFGFWFYSKFVKK